jgi:STE24 endopeptidase
MPAQTGEASLHTRSLITTLLLAFTLLFSATKSTAASAHLISQSASAPTAAQAPSPQPATPPQAAPTRTVTAYTLPPDQAAKSHRLGLIAFWGQIAILLYTIAVVLLILRRGWAARFRDFAERFTKSRFLQAMLFAPLMLLTLSVLTIPMDIAQEFVSRKFGLSIQSWPSWLWDWSKSQLLAVLFGFFLLWILYSVIRWSPRYWWFVFWLATIPISIFVIFIQPTFVDPMFHKFEPLAQHDPALTASLEQMVQRAGQDIPPDRMFWMDAAEKTTELNAYVTGLGASKRIVVWNTTISKMSTPQIVFVAGHEMGHYVLQHIWKGLAFAEFALLVIFWLVAQTINKLLAARGAGWSIRGLGDWASFPAVYMLLLIFSFVASPIFSAFSRSQEHQADQYGLEVTHGLTPDSSQVAAQSFQILGEVDLSDPTPLPIDVLLFYSHPPIPDRVRYALTYNPWAGGGSGEFVK